MRPVDVTIFNAQKVWYSLYGKKKAARRPHFKVGDTVRLVRKKNIFAKGYDESWTEEVFTVAKIVPSRPHAYKLKEYDGSDFKDYFYEEEFQKVKKPFVFRIEKILKQRRVWGGQRQYYVKWWGYPHKVY